MAGASLAGLAMLTWLWGYPHCSGLNVAFAAVEARETSSTVDSIIPKVSEGSSGPLADQQWGLKAIDWVRPAPLAAKPVLVAVLDTGIDGGHEDLVMKVLAEVDLSKSGSTLDLVGHGTAVAGIISAIEDNNQKISGMAADALLLNVKVADDSGLCDPEQVAKGIVWATDHGASVINISLEIHNAWPSLEEAVKYAWDHGALVVAAAGNDGNSEPVYPAAYPDVLAVTAVDKEGKLSILANHGDWVDVAAPGTAIYTTLPGNRYAAETGTSFAAAHVSGLAAMLFGEVTDLNGDGRTNDEVRSLIEAGCLPLEIPGTGRGIINVFNSLSAVVP